MTANSSSEDPFEDVLNLEERFYQEGYEQGTRDGIQAGKIEGRSIGMAKGFDKFQESGRIYSKALVWGNRLDLGSASQNKTKLQSPSASKQETAVAAAACSLPPLPRGNARLEKNVVAAHALVEPETLSMENTDEAVNDFDDRVKRAQGRVKVVERMVGETASS